MFFCITKTNLNLHKKEQKTQKKKLACKISFILGHQGKVLKGSLINIEPYFE